MPVSRPFSLLRTQVAKRCAHEGFKVIGVTSAEPGAGKSFVALNLAVALARVNTQATYLFDFDLSRATVAKTLGLATGGGLAGYLAGQTNDLASIGRRIEGLNLAVFLTERSRGNAAALLNGPRFADLAAMMRQVPDGAIVICDLPPVFANDDAMIVVQLLDAYLAVVNSGETSQKQLAEVVAMLQPSPCLGSVMNRYTGGFADPYGYGAYSRDYEDY
jgi:Mrp family chromosome partitioning ATPase